MNLVGPVPLTYRETSSLHGRLESGYRLLLVWVPSSLPRVRVMVMVVFMVRVRVRVMVRVRVRARATDCS